MTGKLTLYISMSLDGYIAKPGDDLDFLSIVEKEGEDYGYAEFVKTIDTVIIGRRTYDWIMSKVPEFVHSDKQTYVITGDSRADIGNTHFYSGDISELVSALKNSDKQIFCDGGAGLVDTLLKADLIDDIIISIIPILVGNGIRLFKDGRPEQLFEFISVKSFEKGLVQVHYERA